MNEQTLQSSPPSPSVSPETRWFVDTAGSMQTSSGQTLSTVVKDQLRNAVADKTTKEIEHLLSNIGNTRIRINIDRDFSLKSSEIALLLPWYEQHDWLFFSQNSLYRADERTQMNLGAGIRHFTTQWMIGGNAFYDYDMSRYHSRFGFGTEFWRDYLKLGANSYFRLSRWRETPEQNRDYEARPANGWDARVEGWLPVYPQLGGKFIYEKFYGREVALYGTEHHQKNPLAVTVGLNWTPIPLVTLSAEHSTGNGEINDTRVGLQLNWTPGRNLIQQLDPNAVNEYRTLEGNHHDLVERNNHIVLEYRKKELIKLFLHERIEGTQGQMFRLVTKLQTKYPLLEINWQASDFFAAGGTITGTDTTAQIVLPAYRKGATKAETLQLNTYILSAIARDIKGNLSSRAESRIIVTDMGGYISTGNLTATSGAQANGLDRNTVTAIVTNALGRVSGEEIKFTLPVGVSAVGYSEQVAKVISNSDGVATLEITSLTEGVHMIGAQGRIGNEIRTTTTFVPNKGGNEIVNLMLTTPVNNAVADGADIAIVRATVKDSAGNKKPDMTVNFSVTSGASLLSKSAKTDENGVAQTTLTSTSAGTYIVTAEVNGTIRTIPLMFVIIHLKGKVVAQPPSIVADNTQESMLTLTLQDQKGTPQTGHKIVFSNNLSGVTITPAIAMELGHGIYTAKIKGRFLGTAKVIVTENGKTLSEVNGTDVVLSEVSEANLTSITQMDTYNYPENSEFPTTGFVHATFTVRVNASSPVNASDYRWAAQTPSGGHVSWLTVNSVGGVLFNSKPRPSEKSVEIVATSKTGGQSLKYHFILKSWFSSEVYSNWLSANTLCNRQAGRRLPTIQEINGSTNRYSGIRGTIGGVWSEWGRIQAYSAGFNGRFNWSSELKAQGLHYTVHLTSGTVSDSYDQSQNYVMCREEL